MIIDETDNKDIKAKNLYDQIPKSDFAERVCESQPVYSCKKNPGSYTLEDYLALPDDRRVELIDGVIYDMSSPSGIHQLITGRLYHLFCDHVMKHHGTCIPIISPFDVQLDCDDKTMVQPDVMIVCDRKKIENTHVHGAPDLIVEVLSPSTMKIDVYLKAFKYQTAGVREYWMIDPVRKRVMVHCYENNDIIINMYTFEDEVPVGIWNRECKVKFKELYEYVEFLYQKE